MSKVPVLFIIFNRPDRALESFQSIKHYRPECLYLAADGPRNNKEGEQLLCEKTRETILNEIDWNCDIKKLFRNENLGCGKAVSGAISWMFETEEYGVIIEDDCLASDDFFTFCGELLPKYNDDERIAHIAGWIPVSFPKETNTYYFARQPEIWGWATWRRAWKNIDLEMESWKTLRPKIFIRFPFFEACLHYYFWNNLYRSITKDKNIHAWGYQWSIYIYMQNKLCILPNTSLVKNIGFGGENSVHCNNADDPLAKIEAGKLNFPLLHPDKAKINKTREKYIMYSYRMYYFKLLLQKIKYIFHLNGK
jgi:hypothetical protein